LGFLNSLSGFDSVGTGLGSRFILVVIFLEDEDDAIDLVGSDFGPLTSLLGAKTSIMESPGEKYAVKVLCLTLVHHQELALFNVVHLGKILLRSSSPTTMPKYVIPKVCTRLLWHKARAPQLLQWLLVCV
jgi:hypothetical protein